VKKGPPQPRCVEKGALRWGLSEKKGKGSNFGDETKRPPSRHRVQGRRKRKGEGTGRDRLRGGRGGEGGKSGGRGGGGESTSGLITRALKKKKRHLESLPSCIARQKVELQGKRERL